MKKELTRIPQLIAYDYKAIERSFPINGRLIMDIMIFASNTQMKDVFGKVNFTLSEFCLKMGHRREHLQRRLTEDEKRDLFGKGKENPIYTRNGENFEHLIETVFEAALWKAGKENLDICVKNQDGASSFLFIPLISQFDIYTNFDTKKGTKRSYSVVISSRFQDLILSRYNLLELKDYSNIPNNEGYRTFYIFLCRILALVKYYKEHHKPPYYIVSVDQLAALFNCKHTRNDNKKKYITKTLDKINSLIDKAKFIYTYVPNGGKYKYFVQFEFSDETLEYFDEKSKAVFFKSLLSACQDLFINTFPDFQHLSKMEKGSHFKKFMEDENPDWEHSRRKLFWDWFQSDENKQEKQILYKKIFFELFNMYPEEATNISPI